MKTMMIATVAALALMATPALARQTPQAEADLRCFAAGLAMAGVDEDNEELLNGGTLLAFYFLGRLEGREPGVDWITKGIVLVDAEGEELLAGDLPRCGRELEAKGTDMIARGEALGG
jgi:hypothetical protein